MATESRHRGALHARLVNSIVQRAQHSLARNRRTRWGRWVGNLCVVLARGYENDNADGTLNGEWRILDALGKADVATVFDVGANHGDWTRAVLQRLSGATVHAFEIEPTTREKLIANVGGSERVVIAEVGLAAEPGVLDLWIDPDHDDIASTIGRRPGGAEGRTVSCAVESGDRYLQQHDIDRIDLLKVDVEGADLAVLQGFADALAAGRVGAIQFEFTTWAPLARVWLRDFYELLEPLGYEIGKIFPAYVEFRPYESSLEIFVRANFFAVHRSRPDLRQCL